MLKLTNGFRALYPETVANGVTVQPFVKTLKGSEYYPVIQWVLKRDEKYASQILLME